MLIPILIVLAGLAMIIKGADLLTEGSASLARRFKIPELVIGLTIVSIGTSAPEMVVSIMSSLGGNAEIAVGNIVGSNIFNTLVILGITSLISKIDIKRSNITREVPFVVVASLLLFVLSCDVLLAGGAGNTISRIDGYILLTLFLLFMVYTIKMANNTKEKQEDTDSDAKPTPLWKSLVSIAMGLGGLIWGGTLFVDNAIVIATMLGISQHIIAITLMAGGTSLPELATTIVAARKGKTQMAIGNVIGSNIFNILFVLGVSAVIHPLSLGGVSEVDMGVVLLSSLLLFASIFVFGKFKIIYKDGIMFLSVFAAYMIWLLS